MSIAAAYPRWPWSDLVDALLPNGRFLDTQVAPRGQSLNPVGVPIQSYISGLFALGSVTGYYCGTAPASTPCTDRDANLPVDFAEIQAGQPLSADALAALRSIYDHNGAYGLALPGRRLAAGAAADPERLDRRSVPAPARPPRLQPPSLAVPGLPGQPPVRRPRPQPRLEQGGDEPGYFFDQAARFFRAHLKNAGGAPGAGLGDRVHPDLSLERPRWQARSRPRSWRAIHNGGLDFGSNAAKTFTSAGGNQNVAAQFDPIGGTTDSCKTIDITNEPNTATYRHHFTSALHDARPADGARPDPDDGPVRPDRGAGCGT